MRSRDEVFKEFGVDMSLRDSENAGPTRSEILMADRLRELEARVSLPPERVKFVRVSDELVDQLKTEPTKPVTVAIVEDGNELHLTFREVPAPVAASEPVAWARKAFMYAARAYSDQSPRRLTAEEIAHLESITERPADFTVEERAEESERWDAETSAAFDAWMHENPLYTHPSAAGVSEAQIEAAAKAMYSTAEADDWDECLSLIKDDFREAARIALTAAREVQP